MTPARALAIAIAAFARIIAPRPPIAPSRWAAENLVVPDGPKAGELWDASLTPYIVEPLDNCGPDSGVNEQAVRKSAQTGFTVLMIAAIGHSIDRDPCNMLCVQPTDGALTDFSRGKLAPAIKASRVLAAKVEPQTARSGNGSTTHEKVFGANRLYLGIATSAADLSSKTVKKLWRDEIDRWPDDLGDDGDPIEISDGRLTSFLKSGEWRKLDISTPTVKGGSKIDARFQGGDQRFWHMPCPGCGELFHYEPGPSAFFRFERTWPHEAYYVTPCCGSIVAEHDKDAVMRAGRWVATDPRPGAYPSYHFDVYTSPFVPFDAIAKAIVAAGDDPQKLKTLWNLWFGLPFEVKGDAPDHVRLMERREDGLKRGHVPPRGLMLVGAADVQMRGIWVEITAVSPDRQTWVVDAFYVDGDTANPTEGAFATLAQLTVERAFPDAFGGTRILDALAIDSGYRSHVVYAWVRRTQRLHPITGRDVVLATKGMEGWGRPPIGTPALVDIDLAGHKVRKGCQLWPVGTWPLKGAFYADLRKDGIKAGAEVDPEGFCHFGTWLDEAYFRQITAEYLTDDVVRGRTVRKWKIKGSERDNHYLDCRVYNLALAEYLGLSSLTDNEWANLAKLRGVPEEAWRRTLFTPAAAEALALPVPRPEPKRALDIYDRFAALNAED